VVYAPEATQLDRIVQRDGLSSADALARIRAQMPIEDKRGLADVIIDNSGDWSVTAERVRALYTAWARGWSHPPIP
jgi:dephospho-CoA kinase